MMPETLHDLLALALDHWLVILAGIIAGFLITGTLQFSSRSTARREMRSRISRSPATRRIYSRSVSLPGDVLAEILSGLPKGKLVHVVPEAMTIRKTATAYARISREQAARLVDYLPENAIAKTALVDISATMCMTLKAEDDGAFRIAPITAEEQIIPLTGYAEWQWKILPQAAGSHTLLIVATVVIQHQSGISGRATIETYRCHVHVQVAPLRDRAMQFAKDNWKWLVGRFVG